MTDAAAPPTIRWATEEGERAAAADFMSAVIALDARYISHGEIQTGLSLDGRSWAADLSAKMRDDFADPGPDRRIAIAATGGAIVGVGVALFHADERARYMILEDIAVAPDVRSGGIGGRMIDFMEAEARARGMEWAFLESGLHNHKAHALFERRAYAPVSKVFCKKLDAPE
jgi:GNAT superfamily N-acetyltransferase